MVKLLTGRGNFGPAGSEGDDEAGGAEKNEGEVGGAQMFNVIF